MPTLKRAADQEQFEKAQDLLEGNPTAEPGFVKSLFFGRVRMDEVLPYPKQDDHEAQRTNELIARVDAFLKEHVDADWIDVHEEIPKHVIDGLAKLGVLGMTVPREYGGGGFSHSAYCRVLERISAHCASTAVLVGAHQSIGLKALMLMGTEAQKREFLPRLASGEILAAFSLSEPEVGSDAAGVQCSARLADDGKTWILNGSKRYATNAALAGMITVMAKTPITDAKGRTRDKVTAFLVTPDLPGFHVVSHNRPKMGVRGSWQATLEFTDMPVPADRILGQLGKGLKVALSVLDYGRCTLSAGCVGGAKRLLGLCVQRVKSRQQFGRSIGEFHLIKEKIARMAEQTFAMDALTYLAAGLVDRHSEDMMLETAVAKLFCSEGLWQIADDAVQVWGGEGYMREHGIERALRDARINRIVEGTTEVMTAFVALLGMKGVGEEFESVLRAGKHPIGNFGRLAQFARDQWRDIVVGAEVTGLHPQLEAEGHTLARLTHQLAKEVHRLLRTYKQDILDLQLLQGRIAWSAVDLYAMAAVISRMNGMLNASPAPHGAGFAGGGNGHAGGDGHPNGHGHADAELSRDLLIGKGFCRHAADRVTRRLHTLFVNHDAMVLREADAILK
jgi:alkylation response protein AidB-like acyl-CoA dehydrogenase